MNWTRHEKLGEILLAEGVITVEELQRALKIQKDTGRKLGEILVSLGVLDEENLIHHLGEQLGIVSRNLERFFVPEEVYALLREATIRKCGVMPLFLEAGRLHLAMVDPLDTETIEMLERESGVSVEPCISSPGGMSLCISINHGEEGAVSCERGQEAFVRGGRIMRRLLAELSKRGDSELLLDTTPQGVRMRVGRGSNVRRIEDGSIALGRDAIHSLAVFLGFERGRESCAQESLCRIAVGRQEFSVRAGLIETLQGRNLALRITGRELFMHGLRGTGMAPEISRVCTSLIERERGLIVIAAPPGEGKSVTLYAMLKEISRHAQSIYAAEESPLDVLEFANQVRVREVSGNGADPSLQILARYSPHVIAVDECREPDLLQSLLQGLGRRGLVLTTLEAHDFSDAWSMMLSMSGDPRLLADSLAGIVSQRLIPGSAPQFQVIGFTPSLKTLLENCFDSSSPGDVPKQNRSLSTCDSRNSS